MADTYSQLYLHFVFVVSYREALLLDSFRDDLHAYITGIIQNRKNKLLCINSVDDHIHFLIDMNINENIPNLVQELKKSTNKHINANFYKVKRFSWQNGYAVFSVSNKMKPIVINYIEKQAEHHKKKNFKEEYMLLMKSAGKDIIPEHSFNFDLE